MKKTISLLLMIFLFFTCGAASSDTLPEDCISAACKGDVEKLKSLLKKEPSFLNSKGGGGLTLLHFASWEGSKEAVEFLISQEADVMCRSENGETPLHFASLSVNVDVIKFLISRGAEVNSKNSDGKTPLQYAVQCSKKDAVDCLLAHGADINATDECGKTSLSNEVKIHDMFQRFLPVRPNIKKMVSFLFAHGARINTLTEAIAVGDLETIKSMISSDPQLLNSASGNDGETPLWSAAYWDRKEVAELLISLGADVSGDVSPLEVSSRNGSAAMTELLISKGAEVNTPEERARTPLYYAVLCGKNEILYRDTDRKGKNIGAFLHFENCYSTEDYIKVVRLLIAAGADVNVKWDVTPLHISVIKGWREMTELLISAGADVNSRGDKMQSTPLHIAAEDGSRDLVELLISNGADVNAKNKEGKTPLKLALENNRNVIIVLLRKHGAEE